MAITIGLKNLLDAASASFGIKTLNDSSDSTATPLHGLVDATGALISPASSCVNLVANPTTTNAGAYTTGMVVGGVITLANAAKVAGGNGYVQSLNAVVKGANLTAPFDVLFFNANPSNGTYTDFTAFSLNAADAGFLAGIMQCTLSVNGGTGGQILQSQSPAVPFKAATGSTNIYAIIVIRGAETFPANTTGIVLNSGIIQN